MKRFFCAALSAMLALAMLSAAAEAPCDHAYDIESVVEPTCNHEGYTVYVCGKCGDRYYGSFVDPDPSRHTADPAIPPVTTAATCTADGYTLWHCSVCGKEYKRDITPALGHTLSESTQAATCTREGWTRHSCSVCGYTYTDGVKPAMGHEWEETAYADNRVTSRCGRCGLEIDFSLFDAETETEPSLSADGAAAGLKTAVSMEGGTGTVSMELGAEGVLCTVSLPFGEGGEVSASWLIDPENGAASGNVSILVRSGNGGAEELGEAAALALTAVASRAREMYAARADGAEPAFSAEINLPMAPGDLVFREAFLQSMTPVSSAWIAGNDTVRVLVTEEAVGQMLGADGVVFLELEDGSLEANTLGGVELVSLQPLEYLPADA